MQINIQDVINQTIIFSAVLTIGILLSAKRSQSSEIMTIAQTNLLKGIAILMVIFSHIGYFLSKDTNFLFPLSVGGGIGVNIFLFLSGFGLTMSSIKTKLSIWDFYLKRLKRIFLPMWIVLTVYLLADYFLLHISDPLSLTLKNYLGFFPEAHILYALDSPLWYFTLILFYYLIFPIVFIKKYPVLSALIILVVSIVVVNLKLPMDSDVLKLHKLHVLAFPLGMIFANLLAAAPNIFQVRYLSKLRYLWAIILASIFGYTAVNSGIGMDIPKEQVTSLITTLSLVFLVLLIPFESRLLTLLGIFSYEIYLVHWPLMYHYDFLYKYLPGSLATVLYLIFFLLIALGLQKLTNIILKAFQRINKIS